MVASPNNHNQTTTSIYFFLFCRLLQRPFKHNLDFIDAINSAQSSWKAAAYAEHEQYSLEELHYRAGGPASRIPRLNTTCARKNTMKWMDFTFKHMFGVFLKSTQAFVSTPDPPEKLLGFCLA